MTPKVRDYRTNRLRHRSFDLAGHTMQHESPKLDLVARVIDVDTDQIAHRVVIQHDAIGDPATLYAIAL